MPIEGTINSLYLDYEQTKPLFPRTKTKAISDENGVGLDATLSKIQNDLSNKATESFVTNKIAEAQLGGGSGGDVDLSGFATKDDISSLETELNTKVDIDGNSNMTGMLKFKPENGTNVITTETYRNLPTSSPTASYKTRNVIATSGAAMQFFKGELNTDPSEEVNRLTLTENDTQLMKPLTVASGGTGASDAATARTNLEITPANIGAAESEHEHSISDITSGVLGTSNGGTGTNELSNAPNHAIIRKAGDGTDKLHYTSTTSGAFYATAENGGAKFGTLPVAQGGTGRTSVTAGNYLVGNGTKGMVEKTPDEVLKDIGAASADDVADFATETWVNNQIAKASLSGSNVDLSGYVTRDGSTDMIGMLKFKSTSGTSVVAPEVYRNLPTSSPTASYKTRNVIASSGAAMQFFKGNVGADPSTEVNRLTLTESDTQLMKPLTISSGGTGRDLSEAPAGAVFRNASDGTGMYYTPTVSGAMYATAENGTPKFGILPVAQGGTGATSAANAVTNLGIKDYIVAQGTSNYWSYRKWNSGVAEMWVARYSHKATNTGRNTIVMSFPFTLTDINYSVQLTGLDTFDPSWATNLTVSSSDGSEGRTTTSVSVGFTYNNSELYSVGISVYIRGSWK